MKLELKQRENNIVPKDKTDFSLPMKINLNKNIDDSFSKDNKRKRNLNQPKLNDNNKLGLEKDYNNELITNNNSKNKEIKNTDISYTNINKNGELNQNNTIKGNIQVEENISNLYKNQLKKNYPNYPYIANKSSLFCKIIMNCISTIRLGIVIAIIVINVRIYKWTDENPLEEFDKKNNMANEQNININISDEMIKEVYQCQCGEIIINNSCTEEQIISGCKDISINSGKNLLRRLNSDCNNLNEQVKRNGGEMHKVFDLGLDKVHKMALGILIIYGIILGILILSILITLVAIYCCICVLVCLIPLIPVIVLSSLFSEIVILILFIIMLVNYYKGYTTGEFLDYYNKCMETEQKTIFLSIYNKLNKLHNNFTAFVVLLSLELFFALILSVYDKIKSKKK